jgi:membrane-associated phospholipid phosphatase
MRGETLRRTSGLEPESRRLLPRYRRSAALLLVACVGITAGLVVYLASQNGPAWPDASFDPWIQTEMGHFPFLLRWLPDVGTLRPVTLMTLALMATGAATRNWLGAVLAGVAEALAVGLTEYMLKPYVGGPIGQAFPSGHAASMFALAASCAVLLAEPPHGRTILAFLKFRTVRLLLVLMALLLAAAVAAAQVAVAAHTFTDTVGGAAVGVGVVLACALALDLVTGQAYRVRRAPAAQPGPGG